MNLEQRTIKELLTGCAKGRRDAQRELYRRFYAYALTVGLHYSGSREEAEEIVNDAFVKVFSKIDQFDPETVFKNWLRRIVINTAIDHHRRFERQNLRTAAIIPIYEPTVGNDALEQLSMDDVMRMVQRLTPAYRMVFSLHVIEGFKHHEIAEQLGISVGASKSNYSKARSKLKQLLEQYYPEQYKALGNE